MDPLRHGTLESVKPPTCERCGATIEGYDEYTAEVVTVADLKPLGDGGPLYPVPVAERQRPIPGAVYPAIPCGHRFDPETYRQASGQMPWRPLG